MSQSQEHPRITAIRGTVREIREKRAAGQMQPYWASVADDLEFLLALVTLKSAQADDAVARGVDVGTD